MGSLSEVSLESLFPIYINHQKHNYLCKTIKIFIQTQLLQQSAY